MSEVTQILALIDANAERCGDLGLPVSGFVLNPRLLDPAAQSFRQIQGLRQ